MHSSKIGETPPGVDIGPLGDDQHSTLRTQGVEGDDGLLGLRRLEPPVAKHHHPAGGGPIRKRRPDSQADHLLGGAL